MSADVQALELPAGVLALALAHGHNFDGTRSQLAARNDLEAVATWLAEYRESPRTHQSYKREARRFLVWAYHIQGKPLSGLTREDVQAYQHFLADPPPEFCAHRSTRRRPGDTTLWEGPLSTRSRDHALLVLASLFAFLTDMGHLHGNPMARARRTRTRTATPGVLTPVTPPIRYLPTTLLKHLYLALEQGSGTAATPPERQRFERALFVLRFLCNTGLRRAELASAKRQDLYQLDTPHGKIQVLHIVGKGSKPRHVVLNPSAVESLERYHSLYGGLRQAPLTSPLLLTRAGSNRASGEPLSDAHVYQLVREALAWSLQTLQTQLDPTLFAILQRATPHWLRRTYATACLERNIALKHVQEQLGHGALSTTLTYQTSELEERSLLLEALAV